MTTVNNLNIFTFIKEIYQSLKHIDKTMTLSNDDLNKRISKLDDNQQIIIDKLATIEILLTKLGEMNKPNSGLDKNLEFELLEKMKKINLNEVNNSKIPLKSSELTFANILENNYGFNDIHNSLGNSLSNTILDTTTYTTFSSINYDTHTNVDTILENQNNINNESLDKLLF